MREYETPAAFSAAVEARLRERARRLGVAAFIIRRQAALERLMRRLTKVAAGRWALKGGLTLETRLGERARASVDLDADHVLGAAAARADLQRAAIADVGDHFDFTLVGSEELQESGIGLAVRYRLECTLAGRIFEPLQVDVTLAPPEFWDAQPARRPGLLADIGLGPIDLLLIPLERQVAEKLHALTRTYKGGGTTRARDLVDLALIRQHQDVDAARLAEAIRRVFARRATILFRRACRLLPAHWPSATGGRPPIWVSRWSSMKPTSYWLAGWIPSWRRFTQRNRSHGS